MSDYTDYCRRTIDQHKTGFQLVLGGTGLGKTSRIRNVIAIPEYQDRKFIYCANRKQLLEEMAQELDPSCYVVLCRDLEVVLQTLKEQSEAFYELLSAPIFTRSVQSMARGSSVVRFDISDIRRTCQELEELAREGLHLHKLMADHAEYLAHQVLSAFKYVLITYHQNGDSRSYEELLDHPVIQSLFP